MILLGKEVSITNSKLLRFAKNRGKVDLSFFESLDILDCIDLIVFCSELTVEDIEHALDEDMEFSVQIINTVTESLNTGKKTKPVRTGKVKR